MRAKLWVADQPDDLGYDATEHYLLEAGAAEIAQNVGAELDGDILIARPAALLDAFRHIHDAVAAAGHGHDVHETPIPGTPTLVLLLPQPDDTPYGGLLALERGEPDELIERAADQLWPAFDAADMAAWPLVAEMVHEIICDLAPPAGGAAARAYARLQKLVGEQVSP